MDFLENMKIDSACQDLFSNFTNSYKNFMDSKFLYTRVRIFQDPKLKILINAYKKKGLPPNTSSEFEKMFGS